MLPSAAPWICLAVPWLIGKCCKGAEGETKMRAARRRDAHANAVETVAWKWRVCGAQSRFAGFLFAEFPDAAFAAALLWMKKFSVTAKKPHRAISAKLLRAVGGTWTHTSVMLTWTWIMRVCQFRHNCLWNFLLFPTFFLSHSQRSFIIAQLEKNVNKFLKNFAEIFVPDWVVKFGRKISFFLSRMNIKS